MTRDEMLKTNFKPYMEIDVRDINGLHECMLIAANFDTETLILRPFDLEFYEDEDIEVKIKHCTVKKRMRVSKKPLHK